MRNRTITATAIMTAAVLAGCNGAGNVPDKIPGRDGTYKIGIAVGDDVAPGTYRTYSDKCKWKVEGDGQPRSGRGAGTVSLDGSRDVKITVVDCSTWLRVRG